MVKFLDHRDGITAVAEPSAGPLTLVQGEPASEENAARAIAKKHGADFISLSETALSPQVVRLLPQWLATEHNIIAVKFEEDTLYVAMTNPVDLPTLDQINLVTGFNVKTSGSHRTRDRKGYQSTLWCRADDQTGSD